MLYVKSLTYQFSRALLFAFVIVTVVYLISGGNEKLTGLIENSNYSSLTWLIWLCVLYTLVLIIPFAPGMEIGLLIMAMFSIPGIVGAWLATVIGLTIAFGIGRAGQQFLWVQRLLFRLHNPEDLPKAIVWVRSTLAGFPHLSIAVLLNIPGNTLLGGGGGVAVVTGAIGSVTLFGFMATVALASSIIPILMIFGVVTLT